MQEMLNEEILSEILGVKVTDVVTDTNFIQRFILGDARDNDIYYSTIDGEGHLINVYELAFKCKEWAYEKGYKIVTYKHYEEWRVGVFYCSEFYMNDYEIVAGDAEYWQIGFNVETDAIFKVTKWVYEKINK